MKIPLLYVILFLLLFVSVVMGTFNRLSASENIEDNVFSELSAFPGSPPPVPTNDLPCDAIALSLSTSLSTYSNVDATDSWITDNSLPNPSCGSYSDSDVWFKVSVPSSGEIMILTYSERNINWLNKVNFAVYSGLCTSLTEIGCYTALNPNLNWTISSFTGRTAGEILYIRVYDEGNITGNFQISAIASCTDVVANSGSDAESCGLNFTFNAMPPIASTGTWSKVSGPGTASINNTIPTATAQVTVSKIGTYEFEWKVTNGVCIDSDTITVDFLQPPFTVLNSRKEVCYKLIDSLTISQSIGVPVWSKKSGPGTVNFNTTKYGTAFEPEITVSEYGTYEFILTVTNSICSAKDSIVMVFYEEPLAASIAGSISNCGTLTSASLGGNTPLIGSGTWSQATGPGTATFSDINSGNSTATVNIYGVYEYQWSVSNGSCVASTANVTVTYFDPPTANAGAGGDECDLDFSLSATASVGIGSWTKTGGSGNAVFSPNTNTPNATVTVDTYDNYQFTWTDISNGCTDSDVVSVNFYEQPTANAGLGGDECDLDFSLSAIASVGTGSWTKESGTGNLSFVPNANDPNAVVTTDTYGSFTLRWTEVNGSCSDSDDVIITFYEQPTANAGLGGDECDLDFTLSAVASVGTGIWTKESGTGNLSFVPNANDPNAVVTTDTYGSFTLRWTEVNGSCSDSDDVIITFYEQPTANAGLGGDECDLDFTLSAVASVGTGIWTKESGTGNLSFVPNANDPNAVVTTDTYGSFTLRWTEVNGSCSDSDDVIITFHEQPIANAGLGGDECDLDFTLSAVASVGIGSWTKTGGSGNAVFSPNTNTPNATVTVDTYDNYQFTWTDISNGCTDSDVVSVNFYEQPTANAGLGGDECDLNFTLSAVASVGTGSWTKESGIGNLSFVPNANDPNAVVTTDTYGSFTLRWTEVNGSCSDSDDITIDFYEQPIANAGLGGDECDLDFSLSAIASVGTESWTKESGIGNLSFVPNANDPNAVVTTDTYGSFALRWTEVNGSCSNSDDITINFYEQPTANAGLGGDECDLDFSLSAIASVGTGSWTKESGIGNLSFVPNANDPNAVVTTDTYGSFTLRWTEVNGSCSDFDNITINFYEQPIANAGVGGDECDLNFTLSAVASAGTGSWTKVSGTGNLSFVPNANDPNAVVTTDTYGSFTLRWTEVNGSCSDSDDVIITFHEQPIANAGLGGDECDLDFTLSAVASVGIGSWTKTGGSGNAVFSPNTNTPNATVTVDTYDNYQFTWIDISNGCTDSDVVSVNFYEQPTANAGLGGDECDLDFSLSAIASVGTGSWTKESGTGNLSFAPNVNDPNAIVTTDTYASFTLRWTEVNGSCSDFDNITINFYEQPIANAGVGGDECDLDFTLSAVASVGIGSWTKTGGSGNAVFSPNTNTPNATVTVDTYDNYQFTWTDISNGCTDSDVVSVNFYEQPTANAGLGGDECDLDFSLSAIASVGTGSWTKESGIGNLSFVPNANDPNAVVTTDTYGSFTLRWTEVNGSCSNSDDITINFYEQPTANAGLGGDECDLDFSLSAIASVGTGSWTKTGGSGNAVFSPNTNTPNATVIVDAYDNYQFTWTELNNGCKDSDAVNVNFYEQPIANAGVGGDECDLDFILSAVASVGTGSWTKESGTGNLSFAPNANDPNAVVTTDTYGSFILRWTEVNGNCSDSDDVIITFYEQPTANAGLGGNECDLDFALSAVASVGTGSWTKESGTGNLSFVPNANDPNAIVTTDTYGSFTLRWTEVNGSCSNSDDITINFYEQPTANAGLGGDECDLDFSLSATASVGIGSWTKTGGSGNAIFLPNTNTPNATVIVDAYDNYQFTWTELNNGCKDSDAVNVNFYEQPTANAGLGGDECDLNFTLSAVASVGTGSWTKESGTGNLSFVPNANDPNAVVTTDTYGSFILRWTEVNGSCSDFDNITINFYEQPTANAGLGGNECDLDFALSAVASVGTGSWTKESGTGNLSFVPNANDPNAIVTTDTYGSFTLRWTEVNGSCSDSDDITLNFYEQPTANAGLGGDECDLDFILSAVASVGTGSWTKESGTGNLSFVPNANDPNAVVTTDTYGSFTLRWTEVNGSCTPSEADIIVNFHEIPSIATVGNNQDRCGTLTSKSLGGNTPTAGNGSWSQVSGSGTNTTIFSNINSGSSRATVSDYGTYVYRWMIGNGTCTSSKADITVNYYQTPSLASVGANQDICSDLVSTSLGGNTPWVGIGSWSQVSGSGTTIFSNANFGNSIATASQYGTYIYRWTISNGSCTSTEANIVVSFNEGPTVASIGSDQNYCGVLTSISLGANIPIIGNGSWTQISGSGSTFFSTVTSESTTATVNSYGTYLYRWTITNGICISSDDITVKYNQIPLSYAGEDDNICGRNNYAISGSTSSNGIIAWSTSGSGTFDDNTIDNPIYHFGIGELGIITLTKTVGNLECSSVSDDMTITFTPVPTANAGIGGNECDLDFILSAVASVGVGTWTKSGGSGNAVFLPDVNTPKATVNVDSYSTYQFTWTEHSDGCADSDIVNVSFYQQPIADAGIGGDECDFDYTLSAISSSGIGTWTKESGIGNLSFSPNENDPKAIVTTDIYGSYKLRWTESNGSCSDYDEIIVNFYQQPVADAGTGGGECDLDFIFNAIPSVGSGKWTQVAGPGTSSFFPNNSFSTGTVTVSNFGSYQFLWTETNGNCTDSEIINVDFYDQPVAITGNGGNICGLSFSLTATPSAGTGTWTKVSGSGNASFLPNPNSANCVVTVDAYDTYSFRWTEDNGSCTASAEIIVNFEEQPIANAGLGGDQCGLKYSLSAIPDAKLGVWQKISGNGNVSFSPNTNSPDATVTVDAYDNYQFMWTVNNGECSDRDVINITFQEQPIANAGPDINMVFADQVQLNAVLSTDGTGEWTVLNGNANLFDPFWPNTLIDKLGLGENTLQWTETNHFCYDSDEIKLTVDKLFIPTVITPNGDEKNEYFIVRGSDNLSDIQISIFNRMGVEIFTDKNYKNNWNGLDRNGHKLAMGTYFYVIKLNTNKVFKGYVVIKK